MQITKYGHCCLLIEPGLAEGSRGGEQGLKILTDPGGWSDPPKELEVDVVLITHEHPDHLHLESVKHYPRARIITNTAVSKILASHNIKSEILENGQSATIKNVLVEGFGNEHKEIYDPAIPRVQNTGYFIANRLYHPGDAFYDPGKSVEVLALPITGPWMQISEAAEYLKQVKPKMAFPVHDGMLKFSIGSLEKIPPAVMSKWGGRYLIPEIGKMIEL